MKKPLPVGGASCKKERCPTISVVGPPTSVVADEDIATTTMMPKPRVTQVRSQCAAPAAKVNKAAASAARKAILYPDDR